MIRVRSVRNGQLSVAQRKAQYAGQYEMLLIYIFYGLLWGGQYYRKIAPARPRSKKGHSNCDRLSSGCFFYTSDSSTVLDDRHLGLHHVVHGITDAAHAIPRAAPPGKRHPVHAKSSVIVDHHGGGIQSLGRVVGRF